MSTNLKRDLRKRRALDDVPECVLLDGADTQRQMEMSMDVRQALASLPPKLRHVANLLMTFTPAQVERETGYSREKVRGMRRRIQQHLCAMGLDPNSRA